jgi:peptidoglycan-associated lipoprotein
MVSRRWSAVVVSMLVLAVALAGCAKRPATTQASAPAPGGGAGSTPASTGGQPTATTSEPTTRGETTATAPEPAPAPATTRVTPREFAAVPELRDIHFDFDKYDIRPEDAQVLDANAGWLNRNGNMLILIEGHCDERGTNEYNLALGERRAKATMNYLVSQGVQASRITIISYGEERPVCAEKSEECWSKNRRAHFLAKPR